MPKVSVIIPVYNVEKYLRECLDSVVNQTLKDIEIICVNDGSTDNSLQILEEYASKDNRIKVMHKENGGYASAINMGFYNAIGEFIQIVESDDYCSLNMLENLYNNIKNSDLDLINANFYKIIDSEKNVINIVDWSKYIETNEQNFYNIKISPTSMFGHSGPWRNLYRKAFIEKYKLRMIDDDNGSYQDVPWRMAILSKANKIGHIKSPYYFYRRDAVGSSGNIGSKRILKYLTRRVQALKILENNELYQGDIKEAFDKASVEGCLVYFQRISIEWKEEYFNNMKNIFINMTKGGLNYKYFSREQKEIFIAVINKDYRQYQRWLKLKEFNKNFLGFHKTDTHINIALFGIKVKLRWDNAES